MTVCRRPMVLLVAILLSTLVQANPMSFPASTS